LNNVNSYMKDTEVELVVTAISQEQHQLKAVMLRRKDGVFELIRTASADLTEASWKSFAAEFTGQKDDKMNKTIVIGYGAGGVVFYRINVPAVKEEELAALVRMQIEARLPLPVEQMKFAWRTGRADGGKVAVTIAAARKEQLQNFAAEVSALEPAKIILNCEGIVKSWREVFSGDSRERLVLDIGMDSTQVCLVEDGHLSNAASLDIGTNDFSEGQGETGERFTQDMRSVLELFGFSDTAEMPVSVLSDGRAEIKEMVSCLKSGGFNAKETLPKVNKLKAKSKLSAADIYEYRAAIGLAAMALEAEAEGLDIFEGLYRPAKGRGRSLLYTPKIAGTIAAVTLILLVIVCYLVDVARVKAIEKHFIASEQVVNCSVLSERRKLIKEVLLERPDMLKLFSEMNTEENNGIMLDGFHFKKGQPVTISGQVKNDDQLYKFQESLLSRKGISKVTIQSTKKDEKGGKLNFSMTFHYKNFTKKEGRD